MRAASLAALNNAKRIIFAGSGGKSPQNDNFSLNIRYYFDHPPWEVFFRPQVKTC